LIREGAPPMWDTEHELPRAEWSALRQRSDDESGRCASPHSTAKRGGGKPRWNIREVINGYFYVLWTGVPMEGRCRRYFPRRARCIGTWMLWDGRHAGRPITRSMWRCASRKAGSKSDRRDHRQPKGQDGAKRGRRWTRRAMTRARRVTRARRHILATRSVSAERLRFIRRTVSGSTAWSLCSMKRRVALAFHLKIFADAGYQGARAALQRKDGQLDIEIVSAPNAQIVVLPSMGRREDAGMDQPTVV